VSSPSRSAAQIRLLLVEDVPQVSQFIKSLLDAQPQIKLLDVTTDGSVAVEQVNELQPDIIVVDALLRGKMNGLKVAQALRLAGHELPIICLTVPQQPVEVGEGMGLTRVLQMPFSGFDFISLVKELHAQQQAVNPRQMSRAVAVFGAKGGVGTTTLAYNIGAAIATDGLQRVALLDGSLESADLRALLRVEPNVPSVVDLPTNKVSQADLTEIAWRDRSGMDVFFAPPRPEMAEMVSATDMTKLVSLLKRVYNIVVIDTATSLSEVNLALLDAADQLVIVLAWEEAALRQTRAMVGTFIKIGYQPDKLRYLLNRSDSGGGLPSDAIEAAVGRGPDFSTVSDGPLVLAANNRGEAFVVHNKGAIISRQVKRVAAALSAPAAQPAVAR
jgi:pilus assembly protein CpaE